ncbi:hypothetical protein MPER_01462, partial [Moniliophthora perniciosa FA553]
LIVMGVATQDTEQYEQARRKMIEAGFCPQFLWEQKIVWGDHDSFQSIDWIQSRIHWMTHLGHRLGGPAKAQALLKGQGVSLILKSIEVKFRRPVTYPDTRRVDQNELHLTSSAFYVTQQAFVAHGTEVIVWYDYGESKKCDPGEEYKRAVWEPFGGIPS